MRQAVAVKNDLTDASAQGRSWEEQAKLLKIYHNLFFGEPGLLKSVDVVESFPGSDRANESKHNCQEHLWYPVESQIKCQHFCHCRFFELSHPLLHSNHNFVRFVLSGDIAGDPRGRTFGSWRRDHFISGIGGGFFQSPWSISTDRWRHLEFGCFSNR